jgi:hypothetical protein
MPVSVLARCVIHFELRLAGSLHRLTRSGLHSDTLGFPSPVSSFSRLIGTNGYVS